MSKKNIKEIIKQARDLKAEDIVWKPLYPNNMPGNGLEGYYTFLYYKDEEGKYQARKYTILFQGETTPDGMVKHGAEPKYYILFTKVYSDLPFPPKYPSPDDAPRRGCYNDELNAYDVNDYGTFVCVYESLDDAKRRALISHKMINVYVMSHLL